MPEAVTTGCYIVVCPALDEREICYGIDHANDVCYSSTGTQAVLMHTPRTTWAGLPLVRLF